MVSALQIVLTLITALTGCFSAVTTLATGAVAVYTARAYLRHLNAQASKTQTETSQLEQAKRLELEKYYEGLSNKLRAELEGVRAELAEIKADAVKTLSAFYFLISKVKDVFPEDVQAAIKMLEQV